MQSIEKISSFQFFILVFLFVIGSSVLHIPTVLVAAAKEDGWLVSIIGGLLGIGISLFYGLLAQRLRGKNMLQMYEEVFGAAIGKVFTLLFAYFCLILSSMILRGIGDFMVTQIMHETPIEIIMACFVFIIIMAKKYGIEVFARTAEIFFPWIIFLFFFAIVLILPKLNFQWIYPILDNGIKPLIKGTIYYLGFPYFECVLLLMVVPYLKSFQKTKKILVLGTTGGAFVLFVTVIVAIMVLGADLTESQSYVTYILAKKLSIPRVLERMEVIIAVFWIFTIFYKLLLCFFCLTKSIGALFTIENENILAYPLGMLLIGTTIIAGENVVTLNDFSSTIWPFFSFQMGIVLPLLVLLVDVMKNLNKPAKSTSE
ncbi:endospore germination permease [Neobacillus niacini]|uniref:GerAB/ArcD/ProY family transporter n=1 Tax=Neobacillus niacini TaxID=86668 RepID=UPI002FFFF9F4